MLIKPDDIINCGTNALTMIVQNLVVNNGLHLVEQKN